MKCSKCGIQNPDSNKFCCQCGTKLEVNNKCPKCGTTFPSEGIFCPECGTRVRVESIEKDRSSRMVMRPEEQNFLNVSTTDISFPKTGGIRYIDVSSYPGWQISVGAANWVKITQEDNRIILITDENSKLSERTDYFMIKAGSIEIKINIRQDPTSIWDWIPWVVLCTLTVWVGSMAINNIISLLSR